MAKIVGFEGNTVLIGLEDGTLEEYDISLCNFDPQLNDRVEIFRHEDRVVISRIGGGDRGVHINVDSLPTGVPI